MSEAGRIADQTATSVAATVEAVEQGAARAVEVAEARAANAEAAAAAIADSTILQRVNTMIADLKEELEECRDQSETLQNQITEICREMKEIREQLNRPAQVQVIETVTQTPQDQTQSTLPASEVTTTTTTVQPANVDGPRGENEVREQPQRQRRLI